MSLISDLKNDPNILNIYHFGSYVYGTFKPDISDYDFIVICKELPIEYGSLQNKDNITIHYLTENNFKQLLELNDVQALECYYLPEHFILKKTIDFDLIINKENLRRSISTITSNSWVKGKKKLIVQGDYDKYLAIKSIFHSIRILSFGLQIIEEGKINNYGDVNYIMDDLLKLSINKESVELWNLIDTKYRSTFNTLSSRFKKLCPIDKQKGVVYFKKEQKIVIDGIKTFSFKDIKDDTTIMELLDYLNINFQTRS
jgi:predicted nucleotidyltransferase